MTEFHLTHSAVDRSEFPTIWQSRLGAALFIVPAAFELSFGGMRYYEVLYLPLIIMWSCRLPMWSAMSGAAAVSILLTVTSVDVPPEWMVAAKFLDGLRRFVILGMAAILTARLWKGRERDRKLARSDALTGLANTTRFIEAVEAETARCRRSGSALCLLYLDCDRFKQLNDTHGHTAGDNVLCLVARALEASTRGYDIAARLGGDEFALLIADADVGAVEIIAGRVRDMIHSSIEAEDWSVTVSIGVAVFTKPESPAAKLIHAADVAMYQAKRSGPGQIVTHITEQGDSDTE